MIASKTAANPEATEVAVSPEVQWLSQALRGEPRWPPTGIDDEPTGQLLKAAEIHGVRELLFSALKPTPVWLQVPARLRDELTRAYYQAQARELFLEQEIADDLNALSEHGIDTLLLKGTALAHLLYPSPALRPRCDTDLLLRDKPTADRAWQLLKQRGYTRQPAVSGDFVSHEYCCARKTTPQTGVVLDVHWRLSNSNYFAQKFSFEQLLAQRVPVQPLGPSAFALSLPHALMHALLHRLWSLGAGEPDRLLWVCDFDLLCRRLTPQQWSDFIALVVQTDLGPTCADGLRRAQTLLQTPLPDNLFGHLAPRHKHSNRQLQLGQRGWRRALTDAQSLPSWSQRLGLIREQFFPDRTYMQQRFGATGFASLAVAYARRAFRGIGRHLKPQARRL